jgi:hypothetical protein
LLITVLTYYPNDPNWSWRASYLLGDVDLYENDVPDALMNYQTASRMEPNFAPASAMIQYLNQGGNIPASAEPMADAATKPAHMPMQDATITPAPSPALMKNAVILAPAPVTDAATIPSYSHAPIAKVPIPPAGTQTKLVQSMNNVQPGSTLVANMGGKQPGQLLQIGSYVLQLVAQIFEIEELEPIATAIGLAGLLM